MQPDSAARSMSRRGVLQFGTRLLSTGLLSTGILGTKFPGEDFLTSWARPRNPSKSLLANEQSRLESDLTPDQALAKLMTGNQRFVSQKSLNPHQDFFRLTEVADEQSPFATILSCADSRVVPEIIFDQGIGDLFVVRVAGNLAMLGEIASEEYAVGLLGTPLLMVLGHTRCGAVGAALRGGKLPGTIETLALAIRPAIAASKGKLGDPLTNAVKANVRIQIDRLQSSSMIMEATQKGKLKIIGAYYDLDTGEVNLV